MLTVAILINGHPLMARSAVNTGKTLGDGCVVYAVDDGSKIHHRPENGALKLAEKLLKTIKEQKASSDGMPPVASLENDHEPHDPVAGCDCHACAIWERDKLREIVGALRYPIHADDRQAAQAEGKHPRPCARFCEANAFEIGERMLLAKIRNERRLRAEFAATVERCYRMLLSEPDTKGALFKAENILREALAEQKVGAGGTAHQWICPRCKVDRFKEDCKVDRATCPMVATAHNA